MYRANLTCAGTGSLLCLHCIRSGCCISLRQGETFSLIPGRVTAAPRGIYHLTFPREESNNLLKLVAQVQAAQDWHGLPRNGARIWNKCWVLSLPPFPVCSPTHHWSSPIPKHFPPAICHCMSPKWPCRNGSQAGKVRV